LRRVARLVSRPALTLNMPPASCGFEAIHDIQPRMDRDPTLSFRPGPEEALPFVGSGPGEDSSPDHHDDESEGQTGLATKTLARPKKPSQYKVLLLNDDYTPMEFVVMVLKRFFRMDMEQATRVMLHVHQRGVGICGVFPYEVAETKVNQVRDYARENQHPLQCTLEKA